MNWSNLRVPSEAVLYLDCIGYIRFNDPEGHIFNNVSMLTSPQHNYAPQL